VLVANNITMQFGAKPLFENVSVKFGEGYRYGLIGANGSGKSTFMKILDGELEPTAGNVSKDAARTHGLPAPGPVRVRGSARDRRGDDGA
jgi:ATPase subunit of ABC transporter with duplicated ATPase domains